jgi:hypothetical protein
VFDVQAALNARIVGSRPSAVYRGTVYTRTAVLEIDGVPAFDVYDPSVLTSPDVVGTEQAVELHVFCAVVRSSPEAERRVAVDNENRPVFRGVVRALDSVERGKKGVLDVGKGTILFSPSEADEPLHVGSYVQITRAAIHLTDFEGWESYEERHERFIRNLQEGTDEERREAARFFGARGSEDSLDVLIEALHNDGDVDVRSEAATALGRIGMAARPLDEERDPRIEHELRRALKDDNDAVCDAAWLALDDIKRSDEDHYHARDW